MSVFTVAFCFASTDPEDPAAVRALVASVLYEDSQT